MPISSLNGVISTEIKWTAQNNLTGSLYSPVTQSGDIRKQYQLKSTVANTASSGADEFFSFQQAIAGGATATIDLTAMTNVLQQASAAIVRIKGYQIRLLSTADDSSVTIPVSVSVTVTNDGPTLPNKLDFGGKGSGLTVALTTAAGAITAVAIGAAGSGYTPSTTILVAPVQAGGAGGVVAVTVDSGGVPSLVAVVADGTGYTDATVPTTELGSYSINSGGCHMYFDVSAGGFCAVDSTHKNIKVINNDAANTATVEVDVFGGTN